MTIRKNLLAAGLGLVILFIAFQFLRRCDNPGPSLEEQTRFLKDSVNRWKVAYQMSNGREIATQKAVLASQELIDQYKDSVSGYKTIIAQTRVKVKTVYRDRLVPYEVPAQIVKIPDSTGRLISCLPIPARVSTSDDWFSLVGTVDSLGLLVDSLTVNHDLTTTIGWKYPENRIKRFIGNPEPVVTYQDRNPYTKITSARNLVYEPPKRKWYETRFASAIFGLGIGLLIKK